MQPPTQSYYPPTHQRPPVTLIAIGASAGGVEALGTLLTALPAGFPAAVAIVLHIPPERSSLLATLFGGRCALRVKEIEDKEPVLPGTVYFAAPDYHMLVEPGQTFALSRDPPVHFSRPAIDPLLESAALAYRERVLGIILTGNSSDGAGGLRQIRELGGQAWVQDPAEARAGIMPSAALQIAGADRILPIKEMARCLANLFNASWPADAPLSPALPKSTEVSELPEPPESPFTDGSHL